MKYIPTIGLELHCELKSNSKVFSDAKNNYNETANVNVRALDMAFPGTLPVLNKEAMRKALKMSMCLNCVQPDEIMFDRKNYYYPDLPKGYQITQVTKPVGINGRFPIFVDEEEKEVLIHDIHLEEDTASLDHYDHFSLLDYNRSGVPLVEIVTEPCLHSGKEAVAFLEGLRNVYQYCDISEADTKKGQIRCDVNISLMEEGKSGLGTKVEVKNINSFGNVAAAIDYEIERQTRLLEEGRADEIIQETRRYSDEEQKTIRMREKVESIDYKYFVEPNIPKIKISKEYLDDIRSEIPRLPFERKKEYLALGLSSYDANIIVKDKAISDYYEKMLSQKTDAKEAANWIITNILGYLNKTEEDLNDFFVTPTRLQKIIEAKNSGKISSKQAKEIFNKMIEEEKEPEEYLKDSDQISDTETLEQLIITILENNKEQVESYHNGRNNLFDYFVGQVMKETRGKANPVMTKELLAKHLDKK